LLLSEIGITEKKEKQFNKKKIHSVEDLVRMYPKKYRDYRRPLNPNLASHGKKCSMILVVMDVRERSSYVEAVCRENETRLSVSVKWFRQPFMYDRIINLINMEVVVSGEFINNEWGYQFVNPDVFSTDISSYLAIYPIYSKIAGMSDEYLKESMRKAVETTYNLNNRYDDTTMKKFNLVPDKELFRMIHSPKNKEEMHDINTWV